LLELGRLGTIDLPVETVQLEEVVRKALVPLENDLKEKHAEIQFQQPLLPVRGSPVMLEQVFANLLGNALKFVAPEAVPQIRVWSELRDGMVRICIRDNGIGIKPEHAKKLFQPFSRLVNGTEYPGTGIGLAIVRKGVERMGGRVGVDSQPGKGSCFWVELPPAGTV